MSLMTRLRDCQTFDAASVQVLKRPVEVEQVESRGYGDDEMPRPPDLNLHLLNVARRPRPPWLQRPGVDWPLRPQRSRMTMPD